MPFEYYDGLADRKQVVIYAPNTTRTNSCKLESSIQIIFSWSWRSNAKEVRGNTFNPLSEKKVRVQNCLREPNKCMHTYMHIRTYLTFAHGAKNIDSHLTEKYVSSVGGFELAICKIVAPANWGPMHQPHCRPWATAHAMVALCVRMLSHYFYGCNPCLSHWGRDKMAAIFQTTFSNAFF